MSNTIALVIPFRGQLGFLEQAIKSVRESTFKDFRILVFDDNERPQINPGFLNHGEYFPTGGIGLPAVIEYSKKLISEEYVALLAGDDTMSSSRLQLQIDAIREMNSEICLSRMQKFSLNHEKIEMLSGAPVIKTFTKLWLLLGAYGADGTILMTSDFYRKQYILDPNDSYSDWTLGLDKYPNKIAYIPDNLVFYRQHEGQTTRQGRNDFLRSGVYGAWCKVYEDFFKSTPPIESFIIIGAPWFRCEITPADISQSKIYMLQILEKFRSENFTSAEINSLESVMIRRYIFRVNIRNMPSILYVLSGLKIKNLYTRVILELIKIARAIIQQRNIRPRFVRLNNK